MIKKILITLAVMVPLIYALIVTGEGGVIAMILLLGLPIMYLVWKPRKGQSGKVSMKRLPDDGHEFEYWCAGYLLQHGFKEAHVTPGSGDYGADIIAVDNKGCRWVVQCKLYKKPVDNSAVQEVVGAKAHYGCGNAMVMTNSKLTKSARILAFENQVEIWECLHDW